jgi:hypothetical protein
MEAGVTGSIDGRNLTGSMDCLALAEDGGEAIIDFKIVGREKRRHMLEEGRATQLATYAYARTEGGRRPFPDVGYLVLKDAQLVSPSGSRIRGCPDAGVVFGPPIREVWQAFTAALRDASAWLTRAEPIPARPLQDPGDRPAGCGLVIDEPGSGSPVDTSPCRWCDFQVLCGARELS